MLIDLPDKDLIFIYGTFLKQLGEIDKIANTPNCPFDRTTIKNEKEPYLSVTKKLKSQVPELAKLDNLV